MPDLEKDRSGSVCVCVDSKLIDRCIVSGIQRCTCIVYEIIVTLNERSSYVCCKKEMHLIERMF